VLSIDIGIKHLALCILERKCMDYSIHFWDVLNLMPPEQCDTICAGVYKNGNACSRKSLMKFNNICYCKTHAPKGSKNLPKRKQVKQLNYNQIGMAVIECVDKLFLAHETAFKCVDKVVIELQMVRNPKMKFVSHCIMTKLLDKYQGTVPINFIRASRKLKLKYDEPFVCNVKSAYTKRKRKGIAMASWYLDQLSIDTSWKQFFECHPSKHDDLADTLLFCLCVVGC
jgi:hypothetical protein